MIFRKQNIYQDNVNLSFGLLKISLTASARRALEKNEQALFVEMQLHFGCMLRKELDFSTRASGNDYVEVAQGLYVGLKTFMGDEACRIEKKQTNVNQSGDLIGTPRWLTIDYRKGQWSGDFGLTEKAETGPGMISKMINRLVNMTVTPSCNPGNR
jgi:hypothetical protein